MPYFSVCFNLAASSFYFGDSLGFFLALMGKVLVLA